MAEVTTASTGSMIIMTSASTGSMIIMVKIVIVVVIPPLPNDIVAQVETL